MSVRIVTTTLESTGGTEAPDTYFDKIVKYIPSDIIAAWVAATGAIAAAADVPKHRILWIVFAFGILFTFLWKLKQTRLRVQAAISTGAFVVWVFALGGPFSSLNWYNPVYGTLVLIGFTLVTGLINPD
jgi:hypothetical protein